MMKIRGRLYRQLDPLAWTGQGLSPLNHVILAIILASIDCPGKSVGDGGTARGLKALG